MKKMTSKERFMAGLNGEPVDRPPAASVVSVINFELMDMVGHQFPVANQEPEPMAELAVATPPGTAPRASCSVMDAIQFIGCQYSASKFIGLLMSMTSICKH